MIIYSIFLKKIETQTKVIKKFRDIKKEPKQRRPKFGVVRLAKKNSRQADLPLYEIYNILVGAVKKHIIVNIS